MSQPMLRSARQALLRASRSPQPMQLQQSLQRSSMAAAPCFRCQQQWLSTQSGVPRAAVRPSVQQQPSPSSPAAGSRRAYATVSDDPPEAVSRAPRVASASSPTSISIPLVALLRQVAAAAAPSHPAVYATVHIHGRPYLVTAGDRLRLPFRMPDVRPGDELRLDRVGVVGSRSVTAVGDLVEPNTGGGGGGPLGEGIRHGSNSGHVPGVYVRAVVLGVESEPMRVMVKKKRRTRRKRTVRSKHQYTVLRIQEVVFGEEGEGEGEGHDEEER